MTETNGELLKKIAELSYRADEKLNLMEKRLEKIEYFIEKEDGRIDSIEKWRERSKGAFATISAIVGFVAATFSIIVAKILGF